MTENKLEFKEMSHEIGKLFWRQKITFYKAK